MVAADQREQSDPREALLRADGFKPRNRHVDSSPTQPADELGKDRRAGVVDFDQRIGLDHDQLWRWVLGSEALDGATKIVGVEELQRRLQRDHPDGGYELALDIVLARPPDRRARNALKFDCLGPGRRPDAMQHR